MHPEDALKSSERELVNALARLEPASKGIDRKTLMFEAGRRSMRRRLSVWRTVSLLACVACGLSWAVRPESAPPEKIEYVTTPPEQPEAIASSAGRSGAHYLQLQRRVLTEGLDALSGDWSRSMQSIPEKLTIDGLVNELL